MCNNLLITSLISIFFAITPSWAMDSEYKVSNEKIKKVLPPKKEKLVQKKKIKDQNISQQTKQSRQEGESMPLLPSADGFEETSNENDGDNLPTKKKKGSPFKISKTSSNDNDNKKIQKQFKKALIKIDIDLMEEAIKNGANFEITVNGLAPSQYAQKIGCPKLALALQSIAQWNAANKQDLKNEPSQIIDSVFNKTGY